MLLLIGNPAEQNPEHDNFGPKYGALLIRSVNRPSFQRLLSKLEHGHCYLEMGREGGRVPKLRSTLHLPCWKHERLEKRHHFQLTAVGKNLRHGSRV